MRKPPLSSLLVLLVACGGTPRDDASSDAGSDAGALAECTLAEQPPFAAVTVKDGRFQVGNAALSVRGVNSYPLLQHVGYGELEAIDDIFAQAKALRRPLIRTPAFLDAGDNPARIRDDAGKLREAGLVALDTLLAEARKNKVQLILTLTNNWPDFGGAPAVLNMVAKGENLPKNAFWSDQRAITAQLAYEAAIAGRINSINGQAYKSDETILAWELANEARCEADMTPALCDDHTLARWAKRMSDGLRKAGVTQPIAWGGGGYLGEYGEDLRIIAEAGGVDVLTLHMYGQEVQSSRIMTRAQAAVVWGEQVLRARAEVAMKAHLPLLLEEANWQPDNGDAERAMVLEAWFGVARELDVGTLPWMIGETGRMDYDGYLIRPSDAATVSVLKCE